MFVVKRVGVILLFGVADIITVLFTLDIFPLVVECIFVISTALPTSDGGLSFNLAVFKDVLSSFIISPSLSLLSRLR